jgi:hypothetical protein
MRWLSKVQCQELVTVILAKACATVPKQKPEWTQFNESDPGITFLELFAYLTENLLYRMDQIPQQVAAPTKRENYYNGKLLNPEDFLEEQTYSRERLWRRYQLLHGWGIVTGLQVSVPTGKDSRGRRVYIQPGVAVNSLGEVIEVCPHIVPLPARDKALLLRLIFTKRGSRHLRLCRRAPPKAGSSNSPVSRRRLRSCWRRVSADAVSIARLTFAAATGAWIAGSSHRTYTSSAHRGRSRRDGTRC